MTKSIKQNLLGPKATLKDVLTALNKGIFGVVFMVDAQGVMQGLFTDGDVRRALLNNANLLDLATQYMNTNFKSGSTKLSRQENIQLMNEKIRHLK